MKLAYKDLISYLSKKPSIDLLSEKLFQLGHEHEINGDVFDMEITPNRGDCLSLLGLARDLNVFFGMVKINNTLDGKIDKLNINFENLSPVDCPQISFLEIEIDEIPNQYQPYLENYVNVIGNNKTNIFTDVSNYISYELGQPTHCYDSETILSKLTFENKEGINDTFTTLLNSEVKLKGKNCVFTMDGKVVSLAGIMGGASTACSDKTKKVLIECAYFNPESIIGKSIKYNLVSDAAHKFERGVDISSQEIVLRRFAKVIQDHAKIKSIKFNSFGSGNHANISIPIDTNKINEVLGTQLSRDEYLNYLRDLSFDVTDEIKVPSFRHDIRTNNDLAEEIARVIGYNNIKSRPICLNKIVDNTEDRLGKLENFLIYNGFSEVINFPFTNIKEVNSINIDNPLDSNRNNFRTSLKDSLVENLLYNERRQKESIKLFEVSDIYTKESDIKQQKKLGLIISGRLGNNYNDFSKKLDKKYLDNLLNKDMSSDVFQINEIPREALDTKKKDKIYYVEISFLDIPKNFFTNIGMKEKTINFIPYSPVSEYPSSKRDFSFSIADPSKLDKVINMLENFEDDIIKDSFIFDFYKNEKREEIKLGYRVIFQSKFKTLSDNEVNHKTEEIIGPILDIEGVSIPGMSRKKT